MQTALTKQQQRGVAIFFGLCLVCLAVVLWRDRQPAEKMVTEEEIAAEKAFIDEITPLRLPKDSVTVIRRQAEVRRRRESYRKSAESHKAGKKSSGRKMARSKRAPAKPAAPAAAPRNPLDEVITR